MTMTSYDIPSILGKRVAATLYGERKEGRVTGHRSAGILWVWWDGAERESWMHCESLTLVTK